LLVIVAGAWRRVRSRLAWPAFVTSVVATGLVGLAALSGKPLARRIPPSALVAHHPQPAKLLALWVLAMNGASFALAYLAWWRSGAPVPIGCAYRSGWSRWPDQVGPRGRWLCGGSSRRPSGSAC
jgi:hypothetical protein